MAALRVLSTSARLASRTFSSSTAVLNRYADPNTPGAKVNFADRYGNFINGEFVAPADNKYFDVISPVTGKPYTKMERRMLMPL